MPYAIDFEEIERKLFIIEQLAYASNDYCRINGLSLTASKLASSRGDYRLSATLSERWNGYYGQLTHYLSNNIIDCAIKTRIAQDFIQKHDDIDIADIDRRACNDMLLGKFADGESLASVRESCNKIVHATRADLKWQGNGDQANDGYEFWDGSFLLYGDKHRAQWQLQLFIKEWSIAMRQFHSILKEEVDWWNVWGL